MQLERILQKHGFGTRKDCRVLVRRGRVSIGGTPCTDPFADVPTAGLLFAVDGEEWPCLDLATVILHKPAGYECSRKPSHYPGVLELLPPPLRLRGLQPIGRLDQDTTGFLLLTDDGQLNHRLSSARRHVPKVYEIDTAEPVNASQCAQLCEGVVLHDDPDPVRAAACIVTGERSLRLTITEGKYHQVKRMVAAVGNHVLALHRSAIGGLSLPADLAPGQWCWLTAADQARLEGGGQTEGGEA